MKKELMLMFSLSLGLTAMGNQIRNSSFELGGEQFGSGRCKELTSAKIIDPGPAFEIDSTTATQGKNSLKLDLKKAEEKVCWRFSTHELNLKPGKVYTFSFDAKSSTPGGRISFACVSNQRFWQWHSWMTFTFKPEWKRYSMKIKIPALKKGQSQYNDKFWMVLKTQKDCVVWFDAMNFEEGTSSVWKPAAPCESVVSAPRFLVDKDSATVSVSAISYDKDCNYSANVKIDLASPLKKFAERKVNFKLKKGVVQTQKVTFNKIPYGGYNITTIPGVTEHSFVRVHDNKAVFGPGYQVGLISGMMEATSESLQPDKVHLYWETVYGKPGELGKAIRLSGATWNNHWKSWNGTISVLQPEQGKFEWFRTDLQMANARKLNLKPTFAISTQSLLVKRGDKDMGMEVAPWLRKTDRFGKPEGQTLGQWGNFKIIAPPPQVIADHVKAILQRYPNQYEYFMLFGEFNGYMTPQMIIEYAKAVQPVVKKYSPKTKFIAYNPTGDFQGKVALTYEKLMKLGAGKYTDGYSFHPYDSQMDDSPNPAHHAIRAMKKAFRAANADKEMWNTEVYYLQKVWNYNYPSAAITRRFAIDMGEGVRASSPLTYDPLYSNHITPICDFNNTLKDPNSKFAAYNAAGYFLNGAFPVATLENNSTLGYTFKKAGKYYTVLWSKSNKTYITLKGNPKVYDFYGNPLNVKLNRYAVGREPVFLEWGKTNPVKTVNQGVYAGLQDFVPSDIKRVPNGVGLRLRNESGMKLGGFVRLSSKWLEGQTSVEFAPFDNETAVVVPAKIKAGAPAKFPVRVNLTGREQIISVQRTCDNVPVLKLNQKYQLKDSSFMLQYKNGILTVSVDVPDCSRKSAKDFWEGDCVEIYIDNDPLAGNVNDMSLYHPAVSQSGISLAKDGNVPVMELYVKRGMKAKVSPGVKMVATVPVKGKYIGFNISVKNRGVYTAFRGVKNYKDRSQFSLLEL